MKRLHLCFTFAASEEEARTLCARFDRLASPYCRRRYPAHYTPWRSTSPTDTARFIVWHRE